VTDVSDAETTMASAGVVAADVHVGKGLIVAVPDDEHGRTAAMGIDECGRDFVISSQ